MNYELDQKIINGLSETSKKILYGGIDMPIVEPKELGCRPCHKIFYIKLMICILLIIVVFILYNQNQVKIIQPSIIDKKYIGIDKTKIILNENKDKLNTVYNKNTDNIKYTYEEKIEPVIIKASVDVVNPDGTGIKPYESESRIEIKKNSNYEPKIKGFTSEMNIDTVDI